MAEWSTAYVNDLPDSSFLLVYTDAKGVKQRMFPVKDANGKPDADHVRNALARIPQASTLTASQRVEAMAKAKKMAGAHPDIGSGAGAGYEGSAGSGRSRPAAADEMELRTLGALGYQERTFDVELRADSDGRTLRGRAVPYGVTANVRNFRERFLPGAFSRQIQSGQVHRVNLFVSHRRRLDDDLPLAKTASLDDQPDGLYGEWRLPATTDADNVLELVRTDTVTGLSVGFTTVEGGSVKASDGVIERRAVHLDHIALTDSPAYVGAGLVSVRSDTRTLAHFLAAKEPIVRRADHGR
jgi:HK97 family phage prohead protease